jgi:hypothetical protein
MLPTTGARTRYLVLALASRKLIDSLLMFVESNEQDPKLAPALAQFADALKRSRAANNLFSASNQATFSHYEQVLTLQEAMESLQGRNIGAELSGVLDEASSVETRKQVAARVIDFFYAVENRALNSYNEQIGARDN